MKLKAQYLQGAVWLILLAGCGTTTVKTDYAAYFKPFIGSGGH